MRALAVSPHPDDEVLGAGGTLTTLQSHGWQVRNLACTLGRPADRQRRLAELAEAARRMGFENRVMDPLAELSSSDDLDAGADAVYAAVVEQIDEFAPNVVVSPHPHDGHHAHEAVGRGVAAAVRSRPSVTWWMWSLWADFPVPSLFVPLDEAALDKSLHALAAHAGELDRNDYETLMRSRARMSTVLGAERVFGFGSSRPDPRAHAELLGEIRWFQEGWRLGPARMLDPDQPLTAEGRWRPCGHLLDGRSARRLMTESNEG